MALNPSDESHISSGIMSMSGCVREHAPWKVKDGTQTYTDRHASTLPSHGDVFIWTNSNTSASLFTSRLIHHLHSSIEGGRAGAVASLCVCVCVHGSLCDGEGGWEGWGWMINQTTSTQAPNTLTRQGIYIPLHSCQEIGQQWIITPGWVYWREEHTVIDTAEEKGQQRGASVCSPSPGINEDK